MFNLLVTEKKMEIKNPKINEEVLTEDRRAKVDRRKSEVPVNKLPHPERRQKERRNS